MVVVSGIDYEVAHSRNAPRKGRSENLFAEGSIGGTECNELPIDRGHEIVVAC
jgi:hypothetical protein